MSQLFVSASLYIYLFRLRVCPPFTLGLRLYTQLLKSSNIRLHVHFRNLSLAETPVMCSKVFFKYYFFTATSILVPRRDVHTWLETVPYSHSLRQKSHFFQNVTVWSLNIRVCICIWYSQNTLEQYEYVRCLYQPL